MTDAKRPVKLSCRNLWKVFGPNAKDFMRRHQGAASAEALAEAKLIGAVRQASIDVQEGEIERFEEFGVKLVNRSRRAQRAEVKKYRDRIGRDKRSGGIAA